MRYVPYWERFNFNRLPTPAELSEALINLNKRTANLAVLNPINNLLEACDD